MISKVEAILRLEFLIEHWDEIASTRKNVDSLPRKVNPHMGLCLITGYFFHRGSGKFFDAQKDFIEATNPETGTFMYPVGGPEEYEHSDKNLFTNPNRKVYAHWVRDNLIWSLNRAQRISLKLRRPFYKYRMNYWG